MDGSWITWTGIYFNNGKNNFILSRDRLKELFVMWQTLRPNTFNIKTLLTALDKQVLIYNE